MQRAASRRLLCCCSAAATACAPRSAAAIGSVLCVHRADAAARCSAAAIGWHTSLCRWAVVPRLLLGWPSAAPRLRLGCCAWLLCSMACTVARCCLRRRSLCVAGRTAASWGGSGRRRRRAPTRATASRAASSGRARCACTGPHACERRQAQCGPRVGSSPHSHPPPHPLCARVPASTSPRCLPLVLLLQACAT